MSARLPAKRDAQAKRHDLLKATNASGKAAEARADELAAIFKATPQLAEAIGLGLTGHLFHLLIGDNVLRREAVRRQALDLRESLRQAGDGALEELLIERLIVSWLAASDAEEQRAGHFREGCSTEAGRFWDGHVACTSADFARAAKTLASVRRLRLPSVRQLNIGQQQVNVMPATDDKAQPTHRA